MSSCRIHHKVECFIDVHSLDDVFVPVPVGAINQIVFEDLTCNHNKTLLNLNSSGTSGIPSQPLSITIHTRGCLTPITAVIPANRTRVFQVEDFESLTVTNDGNEAGLLSVSAQKTFCICCGGEKKHER